MERAPDTHLIGGWAGPRAGLDTESKRKIPTPAGNRTPIFHPISIIIIIIIIIIQLGLFFKICIVYILVFH